MPAAAIQYWLIRIKTRIATPAIATTMAATNAAVSVRLRCGAFMYHGIGSSSFLERTQFEQVFRQEFIRSKVTKVPGYIFALYSPIILEWG
jgi:hypothetical protein